MKRPILENYEDDDDFPHQYLKDMEAWEAEQELENDQPFYVDIPRWPATESQEFQNVATFRTWEEALAFAQLTFGADENGNINLVTPDNPKNWKKGDTMHSDSD